MSVPSMSELVNYLNRKLTGRDWNTNFQTIVNWLTNGQKDLTVKNLNISAQGHIKNRHSNSMIEQSYGQRPVTENDFNSIPDVIYNPDFIVFGLKNDRNLDTIAYGKNMSDGSFFYLEEVRNGRKTLTTNSMRIYEKPALDPASFADRISNASDTNAGNLNIVHFTKDVNGKIKTAKTERLKGIKKEG